MNELNDYISFRVALLPTKWIFELRKRPELFPFLLIAKSQYHIGIWRCHHSTFVIQIFKKKLFFGGEASIYPLSTSLYILINHRLITFIKGYINELAFLYSKKKISAKKHSINWPKVDCLFYWPK